MINLHFLQNNFCALFFNGLVVYIYRAGSLCGELVASMIAARYPGDGAIAR
jgi:hypothetical protein